MRYHNRLNQLFVLFIKDLWKYRIFVGSVKSFDRLGLDDLFPVFVNHAPKNILVNLRKKLFFVFFLESNIQHAHYLSCVQNFVEMSLDLTDRG